MKNSAFRLALTLFLSALLWGCLADGEKKGKPQGDDAKVTVRLE